MKNLLGSFKSKEFRVNGVEFLNEERNASNSWWSRRAKTNIKTT
jgi:hypothetical protein